MVIQHSMRVGAYPCIRKVLILMPRAYVYVVGGIWACTYIRAYVPIKSTTVASAILSIHTYIYEAHNVGIINDYVHNICAADHG